MPNRVASIPLNGEMANQQPISWGEISRLDAFLAEVYIYGVRALRPYPDTILTVATGPSSERNRQDTRVLLSHTTSNSRGAGATTKTVRDWQLPSNNRHLSNTGVHLQAIIYGKHRAYTHPYRTLQEHRPTRLQLGGGLCRAASRCGTCRHGTECQYHRPIADRAKRASHVPDWHVRVSAVQSSGYANNFQSLPTCFMQERRHSSWPCSLHQP